MSRHLGVVVMRKAVHIALVEPSGPRFAIVWEADLERHPDQDVSHCLRRLLENIPPDMTSTPLSIALTSHDLPCADTWRLPDADAKLLDRTAPALTEARCAGESLEELVLGTSMRNGTVMSLAMKREELDAILAALEGWEIQCITCLPAALGQVLGNITLRVGGEHIEVSGGDWRSHPVDTSCEEAILPWNGLELRGMQPAALATALCDEEAVPNLLAGLPGRRRDTLKRSRGLLTALTLGGAILFAGLGIRFNQGAKEQQAELAAVRRAQATLGASLFPEKAPREESLLATLKKHLLDVGELSGDTPVPSMLGVLGDIGEHLPDADQLQMTLESLDLSLEGGRLIAQVPAGTGDPLKSAALLEASLNRSSRLKARGDYEIREGKVIIRLRMEYQP